MECEPKPDYGRKRVHWEYDGQGYNSAVGRIDDDDMSLHLTTDLRLGFEGGRARARSTLRDGDTAFVALSWSEHAPPRTYDEAYHRLVFTADFWHEWLSRGEFPDHPWKAYLARSALTLKGLTYAPTGAMVAAATTSLPETPGGLRNWDYRYAWIRDSTFMLWGLYTLGFDEEANDFFYFIRDVVTAEKDELQIMYGIGGETELEEYTLDHLSGYENARPVRIGNGAYNQRQHDVWGALLDSIWLHTKSRDGLAESTWQILVKQVEDAISPLARARPRHLGGARRAAALHVVEAHVLGRVRPRRAARAAARGLRARDALAGRGGRDPRRHLRERRRRARRLLPALRDHRARRVVPDDPARALPAARRPARDRDRQRDRRGAHRAGPRAPLPRLGDRRRPGRRGGVVRDLLVLARERARRDRRDGARPGAVRAAARVRLAARAVRRGDRRELGPPPGQLPPGVHPPGAHQRGDARHPRRPAGRPRAAAARHPPPGACA